MPGLIDDSLQAMGDATSSMGVAADAMAQNDVQNLALKQAKRQMQFQYIDTLRGLAGQVAAPPSGEKAQNQQAQPQIYVIQEPGQRPSDRGDDPNSRFWTEPMPRLLPSEPAFRFDGSGNGGVDALIGGIGQSMFGGFLNSQSAPPLGSEDQ